MTKHEAHCAILEEIATINFCGHCLEMKCSTCEKEQARKEAIAKMRANEQDKRENDLIAEYIKENYPELLQTMDFAVFKLTAACRKLANDFLESFKQIDLTELKEWARRLNESTKQEGE